MRSRTPSDLNGFCKTCLFKEEWCLCEQLPTIHTTLHFVIVRHTREVLKTSNTGRIAALALDNCSLIDFGVKDKPYDPTPLLHDDTWLLFPDNEGLSAPLPETPPKRVVLLDATWRQAKRMKRRIKEVHHMPRFGIPTPNIYPERLRQAPNNWSLSTIEAIARTAEFFGEHEAAKQIDGVFALMVDHFTRQRGWPTHKLHNTEELPLRLHTDSRCSYTKCYCQTKP
ncbi:MAG: hypothetical protein CL920_23595 [Deltaproteobacteria bacterium]|nr:hypothetical protein [Deltaproteobacteria bacterium]MBU51686.1 hypothetical protein [Deltaproteobacteria bacterium]